MREEFNHGEGGNSGGGSKIVALLGLWFGYLRHHFPGPPADVLLQLRSTEATNAPMVDPKGVQ